MKKLLQEIDILKHKLDSLRPLTDAQVKNLKTLFDVDFTFNSTAIEGNTLSLNETKLVLLERITIGGKSTREHLEIINHKEAIDYIEKLASKKTLEITPSDILGVHNIILRSIDFENAGIYRRVPVYVKKKDNFIFKFPEPLKIYDLMNEFFDWLTSSHDTHPVLFAVEAHTRFVSIHPFTDGNGRTARLILNLLLFQFGYPPAVIKVIERAKYLDTIDEWDRNGNLKPIATLVATCLKESLLLYIETIEKKIIWK
ncbi:MAG TPA: Fic family protein [Leptospiraceae bacterium]|nr:Fic family protein [Leptospiraceae bacterium]